MLWAPGPPKTSGALYWTGLSLFGRFLLHAMAFPGCMSRLTYEQQSMCLSVMMPIGARCSRPMMVLTGLWSPVTNTWLLRWGVVLSASRWIASSLLTWTWTSRLWWPSLLAAVAPLVGHLCPWARFLQTPPLLYSPLPPACHLPADSPLTCPYVPAGGTRNRFGRVIRAPGHFGARVCELWGDVCSEPSLVDNMSY